SFFCLFADVSLPHRVLHSFPTRRSSDLWGYFGIKVKKRRVPAFVHPFFYATSSRFCLMLGRRERNGGRDSCLKKHELAHDCLRGTLYGFDYYWRIHKRAAARRARPHCPGGFLCDGNRAFSGV